MGQYWEVLNADKHAILHNPGSVNLEAMLYSGGGLRLLQNLVKPQFQPLESWATQITGVASQTCALMQIPAELFDGIASCLSWGPDAICLALTCKSLWVRMQPAVRMHQLNDYASWAGDRIWVKGDYANSWPDSIDHVTALPKSFIEMELEFSGEGKAESEEEVLEKYADSPPCAFGEVYDRKRDGPCLPGEISRRLKKGPCASKEHMSWFPVIEPNRPVTLGQRSSTLFPPDKTWVLRNLCDKNFVRLDAIVSKGHLQAYHAPFVFGLGELFFYHMGWTDDPSGALGVRHGVWAGHCFDVTVFDEIVADANGGWVDVSVEFSNLKGKIFDIYRGRAKSMVRRRFENRSSEDRDEEDGYE